jgi:hypothetical protein
VSWYKITKKWTAQVYHGGKQENLGVFATEEEAKVRRNARCHELGIVADAGEMSSYLGVSWNKERHKWSAYIYDGENSSLGFFEATARGEVDAALAYDRTMRAAGRPERTNYAPAADSTTARLPTARPASSSAAGSAHREAAPTAPPTTVPTASPKAAQTGTLPRDDATAASEGAQSDETEIEMILATVSASVLATAATADSEDADLAVAIELSLGASGDRGAAAAARGPPAAATAEPVPLTLCSSIRSSDS